MLLTKTVKIKWHPSNKKYYELKGYKFTKWKDEFEVKVEDLSNGAKTHVDVMCDECKEILIYLKWQTYKRYVHEDGKYYCNKCAKKLFGNKQIIKTRLKHSKSFAYWLIENLSLRQAVSIIARWNYKLNECDPRDITYGSNGKFWFKCKRGIHPSELKHIKSFTSNNQIGSMNCNMCNSFAQYLIDNYGENALNKYWSDKNTLDPWKISKGSSTYMIWIKCQNKDYHIYNTYPNRFTTNNQRCPYCHNDKGKVHKYDSLGWLHPESFKYWSIKNKKSPYDYSPSSMQKVWWICPSGKHEDFKRNSFESIRKNFRCPECVQERDESLIQEKTRLYLESLHIGKILHESNCTLYPKNIIKPPSKRRTSRLRYDNEIIINNKHLFIEVMGSQHEKICSWHRSLAKRYETTPQQELDYQIAKDKYKEQYVYDQGNNYYYLAIWYYDFNDNTYKKLIDDKINKIQI